MALVISFPLVMQNSLDIFQNDYPSLPCQNGKGDLSWFLTVRTCGIPGGEPHESVRVLLRLWALEISHSHADPHAASRNLSKLP
jgi:hypothetical protein